MVGRYNFGGKALIGLAVLQYDNLCIDPNQRRAFVSGRAVELTTMEFNIGPVDKDEIWAEKSYSQPIFYP